MSGKLATLSGHASENSLFMRGAANICSSFFSFFSAVHTYLHMYVGCCVHASCIMCSPTPILNGTDCFTKCSVVTRNGNLLLGVPGRNESLRLRFIARSGITVSPRLIFICLSSPAYKIPRRSPCVRRVIWLCKTSSMEANHTHTRPNSKPLNRWNQPWLAISEVELTGD